MCSIDMIRLSEDQTMYWSVDENGEALDLVDTTDADFRSYICECGEQFGENSYNPEKSWQLVLRHIKEQGDE